MLASPSILSCTSIRRATSIVALATLLALLTVRRATSLVPPATLPGPLTRASLLSCTASSPSHLARASCNLARSANPLRVDFPAPQVRRAPLLSPLATLPGHLSRERLLSCTTSSLSHLARASGNLAGYAGQSEYTFLHRRFAEPPHSCLMQPCPVRRATSFVPHATVPGLLTRASVLSCTAGSPSHLIRASCNRARSANSCERTFLHRRFAEPPHSCLMQPCPVRRATSFVPHATVPGLLTRASVLSCTAGSPSHLIRASCNRARSANSCERTFLHRRFAEPPHSCLMQPCPVRRATSFVPHATVPGLLTRASVLSCTAGSPSHLAPASCNLAGSANPCEFTFLHRKFAERPRSCLLQPCRLPQVRLPTSFVPLSTMPGLVTRASLLSCTAGSRTISFVPLGTLSGLLTHARLLSSTASSASHLARASWNLAVSAKLCEVAFWHHKFAEPPPSCLLQPCSVC
ncbi:hypothetical protein CRG98_029266 [Punica granatum]|uniref:Uncharacterized protein n=1 Tax=Punica granatum TaxID=22663 RepID=A0A2I0J282_PUNGR|nr:hypothetical protein CRG98_029266 [Punica granatum]